MSSGASLRQLPVLLTLAALLVGTGCWQLAHRASPRSVAIISKDWGDPNRPVKRSGASTQAVRSEQDGATSPGAVPAGSTLTLSRLAVQAPIVPVDVRAGVMAVPRDPHTLGWWAGGAVPGASTGSAVIVGHVNYAGTAGVLGTLAQQARPGDELVLTEHRLRLRYRITALRTYAKTSGVPATAFRRDGPPRLVLITCGGPFDPATGNYLDNIVAYAEPETAG